MQKIIKLSLIGGIIFFGLVVFFYLWGMGIIRFSPYDTGYYVSPEKFYKMAIDNHDISVCDKIRSGGFSDSSSEDYRGACYRSYVKIFPKEDVCKGLIANADKNTVEGISKYIEYNLCVTVAAETANDASMCLKIDDSNNRAGCVSIIAGKKNNPEICKILKIPSDIQKCLNLIRK